ncbi:MAG TPA: hypothetical protein VFQ25_15335 [Ktedonobacterales bacterium]|nr:hypothetical protein [Ktedonobacterales bacterium]
MRRLGHSLLGAAILLALALAGCGDLRAGSAVNTSESTITTGPVTIATDHSAYAPTDTMNVTIVNHLAQAIYAVDTQASCSILSLEVQQAGQWGSSDALHCPLGRAAMIVKIEPGATYTVSVGAGVMSIGKSHALPNGAYRLVLRYYTTPPSGATQPTATAINSATLTVNGSVPSSEGTIPSATSMAQPSK